jgi:hypothetical protein
MKSLILSICCLSFIGFPQPPQKTFSGVFGIEDSKILELYCDGSYEVFKESTPLNYEFISRGFYAVNNEDNIITLFNTQQYGDVKAWGLFKFKQTVYCLDDILNNKI